MWLTKSKINSLLFLSLLVSLSHSLAGGSCVSPGKVGSGITPLVRQYRKWIRLIYIDEQELSVTVPGLYQTCQNLGLRAVCCKQNGPERYASKVCTLHYHTEIYGTLRSLLDGQHRRAASSEPADSAVGCHPFHKSES